MNDKLVKDILKQLHAQEQIRNETWKARAYAQVIKQLDDGIAIDQLKGVGKGIQGKIKEILETGKSSALDPALLEKIATLDELTQVHGIGAVNAMDLYDKGIRHVSQLNDNDNISLLNEKQKIGLLHYNDFKKRIPFKEMEKHEVFLQCMVGHLPESAQICIAGSYRRKAKSSGDIDVIITGSQLKDFIGLLKREGYITDILALGDKKCLAVCKLDKHKTYRRIDIMYTTPQEFPFAVLYFTGSKEFNIKMRNKALSLGYSLNEFGLTNANTKNTINKEKDIFDFLKMDYVEPENR